MDWADQAILHLHLGLGETGDEQRERLVKQRFREYGIRTSTDLEATYAATEAHSDDPER